MMSEEIKYPQVTMQQMIDAGINGFAVKLLGESIKENNITETISFRFGNIGITIKPLTD